MTVDGPPFYDETEWEPDGPTLKEMLDNIGYAWHGNTLLSPHQIHTVQKYMVQEYGRAWKGMMKQFLDKLTPVIEGMTYEMHAIMEAMAPVAEVMTSPKPPKNGPQYNPHARRGKGGRR